MSGLNEQADPAQIRNQPHKENQPSKGIPERVVVFPAGLCGPELAHALKTANFQVFFAQDARALQKLLSTMPRVAGILVSSEALIPLIDALDDANVAYANARFIIRGQVHFQMSAGDALQQQVMIVPENAPLRADQITRFLQEDERQSRPEGREARQSEQTHIGARILVAEDNPVNSKLLMRQLQALNFQVGTAANGAECLDRLRSDAYDIVLMDLEMPVMDGMTAVREIRKLPEFTQLPVIALSAHTDQAHVDAAMAAGCSGFLQKPASPEALAKQIARHLYQDDQSAGAALGTEKMANKADSQIEAAFREELQQEFLAELQNKHAQIREALIRRDFRDIRRQAHNLKGMAGNFATDAIVALCHQIETAAERRGDADLSALLRRLEQEISRSLRTSS